MSQFNLLRNRASYVAPYGACIFLSEYARRRPSNPLPYETGIRMLVVCGVPNRIAGDRIKRGRGLGLQRAPQYYDKRQIVEVTL